MPRLAPVTITVPLSWYVAVISSPPS